jgi:hypothetical protein
MPLTTPYKHIPQPERKFLGCYVDPKDVAYLERIFPMQTGLNDRVLCNLFRAFILHLKSLEPKNPNATDTTTLPTGTPVPGLTPTLPHEPAFYVGSPTYVMLDTVIANINFNDVNALVAAARLDERSTLGRTAGEGRDNDVTGGADSIRPAVCPPAEQCAKPQGSTSKRGRGKAGSKTKDKEKGQRGDGPSVPLAD